MSIDVMKQALEALEEAAREWRAEMEFRSCIDVAKPWAKAAEALRAAIEQAQPEMVPAFRSSHAYSVGFNDGQTAQQQEQEPVAWVECDGELVWNNRVAAIGRNLYTAPPPRQWQGLTSEELWELWNSHTEQPFPEWFVDFKRAYEVIAEKLKEKNT